MGGGEYLLGILDVFFDISFLDIPIPEQIPAEAFLVGDSIYSELAVHQVKFLSGLYPQIAPHSNAVSSVRLIKYLLLVLLCPQNHCHGGR